MISLGTQLDLRDAIQKVIDENPAYKVGYIDVLLKIENGKVKVEDAFVWDDEYLR
jgi:hypothetical protein